MDLVNRTIAVLRVDGARWHALATGLNLMHVVQAERAIMQAFIPGSGPTRPYLADRDVEAPRTGPGGSNALAVKALASTAGANEKG